jgi:hypothetical protein
MESRLNFVRISNRIVYPYQSSSLLHVLTTNIYNLMFTLTIGKTASHWFISKIIEKELLKKWEKGLRTLNYENWQIHWKRPTALKLYIKKNPMVIHLNIVKRKHLKQNKKRFWRKYTNKKRRKAIVLAICSVMFGGVFVTACELV